ncbi:MAG: electron transfer flavoprotein subunit beta/FixA family protein [Thermoplasmata archaeon]|nr:electron transfer flavoprotein subunit beta/FixA family protein [Thermoplasmata archaeon]
MEIVVLVKPTPDAETRLRPSASGTSLDPEGIKWVLAGYDESAVEQALLLKESIQGVTVRAVAFGPAPRAEEVLRASLALGCDTATWIEHPKELVPDALVVARAISAALDRIPHQVILAGKQAGDDEEGLVPLAVAEFRGLPGFGFVTNLRWDAVGGRFTFDRSVEGAVEHWAVSPPVVFGLQQAWNDPRTAKLPNILKSRKAPIDRIAWSELSAGPGNAWAPRSRTVAFQLPTPRTGAKMIPFKTPEEAAQQLVRLLREEAKVFP